MPLLLQEALQERLGPFYDALLHISRPEEVPADLWDEKHLVLWDGELLEVSRADQTAWALAFPGLQRVEETEIEDCTVSTVFLPISVAVARGRPFETMIIGGDYDGKQWRWPNLAEAMAGHHQIVRSVSQDRRRTENPEEFSRAGA